MKIKDIQKRIMLSNGWELTYSVNVDEVDATHITVRGRLPVIKEILYDDNDEIYEELELFVKKYCDLSKRGINVFEYNVTSLRELWQIVVNEVEGVMLRIIRQINELVDRGTIE